MYCARFFNNNLLKDYIESSVKRPIFSVGNNNGTHLTCFSSEKLGWRHTPFEPLVNFHIKNFQKFGIKLYDDSIYVEHREIIMKQNDKPFKGHLHMDSFMDTGLPCLTCVYYYRIDKTLKGGDLIFPPFGKIKPKENYVYYFDGYNNKHKIGELSGTGVRGTIICNISRF